jgi:DnaJ family protein C protein 3
VTVACSKTIGCHVSNFSEMLKLAVLTVWAGAYASTTELLNQAKKFMALGKYQDALQQYDLAIEKDPNDHVTYFRRASAYMIIGRNEHAIRDFDKVLQLKKDNHNVPVC